MNMITQDMKYKQSMTEYSLKHGVSKASCKYDRARSHIYFWLSRYDGIIQSPATKSNRHEYHPNEHNRGYTRRLAAVGIVDGDGLVS